MEQYFPKGKLTKPLSDKQVVQFRDKMKSVVWAIKAISIKMDEEFDDVCQRGLQWNQFNQFSGFCIDKKGLILTVWHGVSNLVAPEKKLVILARRDLDGDEQFTKCKLVHQWQHFDLALIKVEDDATAVPNFKGFDYAIIEDGSRQYLSGMQLFSIGLYQSQGYHLFVGSLITSIDDEDTDYDSLGLDNKVEEYDHHRSNLVDDKMPPVDRPKGLHPDLKLVQASFGGRSSGLSGSPVFSSEGRVVSMQQKGLSSSSLGVTHRALMAFVRSYEDS